MNVMVEILSMHKILWTYSEEEGHWLWLLKVVEDSYLNEWLFVLVICSGLSYKAAKGIYSTWRSHFWIKYFVYIEKHCLKMDANLIRFALFVE